MCTQIGGKQRCFPSILLFVNEGREFADSCPLNIAQLVLPEVAC
jgi:hypothetical protein